MRTNGTLKQLEQALMEVNKKYEGNIIWKREPERKGKELHFTLRVKNSRGPGAKISINGRHLISACWHVHGNFFDELLEQDPTIYIKAMRRKITSNEGNWVDWKEGSLYNPIYASELCGCLGR